MLECSGIITRLLVKKLIKTQFPEFSHLNIEPVKFQGHDNRTFRLGTNMLIRMPITDTYALSVSKEQALLPKLAPYLSIPIPFPMRRGKPSNDYPFDFSLYRWLEGDTLKEANLNETDKEHIALQLALFLKELQTIKNLKGPLPGLHNWYRGAPLSVYDRQTRKQIDDLQGIINTKKAFILWEKAINTQWLAPPVWIHGDFGISNILVKNGKLSGVIDFGCMGVGDPSCDLVIAWTFLKNKSRKIFYKNLELDKNTWIRAKGWALWKASYELCATKDKLSPESIIHKEIIQGILEDPIIR